jgi:hypothetical protein
VRFPATSDLRASCERRVRVATLNGGPGLLLKDSSLKKICFGNRFQNLSRRWLSKRGHREAFTAAGSQHHRKRNASWPGGLLLQKYREEAKSRPPEYRQAIESTELIFAILVTGSILPWNGKPERSALAGLRVGPDPASMLFDNAFYKG